MAKHLNVERSNILLDVGKLLVGPQMYFLYKNLKRVHTPNNIDAKNNPKLSLD